MGEHSVEGPVRQACHRVLGPVDYLKLAALWDSDTLRSQEMVLQADLAYMFMPDSEGGLLWQGCNNLPPRNQEADVPPPTGPIEFYDWETDDGSGLVNTDVTDAVENMTEQARTWWNRFWGGGDA